jgi:ubiquinone/menaquinone biosynthesis C-methylase UbiE
LNSKSRHLNSAVVANTLDVVLRRILRLRPIVFGSGRLRSARYIAYLQRAAVHPAIRTVRVRAQEYLALRPGHQVLDIGCGPGTLTVEFGRTVGEQGRVVGIDVDRWMVAAAKRHAEATRVSTWTTHRRGDCTALPFPSETFDACYCERVLQHLRDPAGAVAIAEGLRVLKPGGHVVFVDTDWTTLSVECDEPLLGGRIASGYAAHFANPGSGQRLQQQFESAGAAETTAEAFLVVMDLDVPRWLVAAAEDSVPFRSQSGRWPSRATRARGASRFIGHVTVILVAAKKHP